MGRFLRSFLPSVAIVSVVLFGLGIAGWWTMHTAWFMNLVRERIVSQVERATGGRVELGGFTYDTDSLSARATDFIVHGGEPAGVAPLLRVQSLQIGLKILSLWRRDIDLQSLIVDKPEVHLIVAADGNTNVLAPKSTQDPIQQLLELKIGHAEIHDGLVSVNDSKTPLDLITDHVELTLAYDMASPSYDVSLSLPSTDFKLRRIHPGLMSLVTKAHLFRSSIRFDSLKVAFGSSTVSAAGVVERFDHPTADLGLEANLSVDDLAKLGGLAQLQNGTARAKGKLHFDSRDSQFTFTGPAEARNVNYVSRNFTLRGMNAAGDIAANNDGMSIHKATAAARGANFHGEATIREYNFLKVQGNVDRVSLREVGTYLTAQTFPWSGSAFGPAFASASLLQADPQFIIGAQVQISPESGAIPVSGNVGITYFNHSGEVQFAHSQLSLPHSQIAFDGTLGSDLNATVDGTNIADLRPILPIIGARVQQADIPTINAGGRAHFNGVFQTLLSSPSIKGELALSNASIHGQTWESIKGSGTLSSTALSVPSFEVQGAGATATGSLSLGLAQWTLLNEGPVELNARFSGLNIAKTAALISTAPLPVLNGLASGSVHVDGFFAEPKGSATFRLANLDAYGEQINQVLFDAAFAGDTVTISKGRVQAGPAQLNFSGEFQHNKDSWSAGDVHVRADTNGFPLASLSTIRKYAPTLVAQAEAHFAAAFRISSAGIVPLRADGAASLRKVRVGGVAYGDATLNAITQGKSLALSYSGKLLQTQWEGKAQADLTDGTPIRGELRLGRLDFGTLKALVPASTAALPVNGFVEGGVRFDGSLEKPEQMRADLTIDQLQISSLVRIGAVAPANSTEILLRNKAPILIQAANGVARVRSFEIMGKDTSIAVTGDAPFIGKQPLNIKAVGKANLQMFSLFDPNVQSSGASEVAVNIAGTLASPTVTGALQLTNGSFFLTGIPNGLSAVNGTVVFTRNRATIQKMSGRTGGGDISLTGFVSFGVGSPLVYHVEGVAQNVRVRYANSISVTANSDLRLSGTSSSSILSGNLTVSRVVFTPNADVGNLLAAVGASTGAASSDEGDFLTGLHLDVAVESAPNLQVSTNLSRDVEAEIQLRLRGTPDHPILLGSIAANQGDLRVFGTRYSLNRGEVNFVNTVRAEPILDLDLETQTRGVTVDITISGTPSKLNFNYRSDPPLQPRDIIALLTVGRAPGVGTTSNPSSGGDVSALSSGVNTVLGQAISPVSNRLSRLFGIANIRIDPFVQGLTNTPQARLSVEQQISRDITVTYVTNLSQTSEQIFRFEWALSRQFYVVALRDDNGEFGIDFQYKKRFK